jgi:MFS family permease
LVSFVPDISKKYLIFPMLFCGMFYACFGGFIWNSIALVVREDQLGIAYGTAYAFINTNLVITPMIYGCIHDTTKEVEFGYFWSEIFIICQISFCILMGIMVFLIDIMGDKKLIKRIEKREIYESMQKNATKSFMSFG